MSDEAPVLHLICGKIASGKSTLAARLATGPGAVLISEDDWLAALFGDQMTTPKDYVRFSARLRDIMGPHVAALLNTGQSVVLDFPATTVETRQWMRGILDQTSAAHVLHVLNPPDDVCLARLRARNEGGEHAFAATEEQFRLFTRHFALPTPDEGFTLVIHEDPA